MALHPWDDADAQFEEQDFDEPAMSPPGEEAFGILPSAESEWTVKNKRRASCIGAPYEYARVRFLAQGWKRMQKEKNRRAHCSGARYEFTFLCGILPSAESE